MKRIIMFVLLFAALKVAGQTTGYLRFDTVKIMKQNGTCELYVLNKTKDSLGLLINVGGGLTQFRRSKMLNDSTIIVGLDTLTIHGTGGGAPSGPAGGDLTGTFPNPSIDAYAVDNSKLAQMPGLSVKGNIGNTTDDVGNIVAANDGNVLRRFGTSIGFGAVNLASSNAITGTLPIGNIDTAKVKEITSRRTGVRPTAYAGGSFIVDTSGKVKYADAVRNNLVSFNNVSTSIAFGRNAAHFSRMQQQGLVAAHNESLNLGKGSFSIGAWVKFDTLGALPMVIMCKDDNRTKRGSEYYLGYYPAYNTGGYNGLVFQVEECCHASENDGTTWLVISKAPAISANQWYFVAGMYDADSGKVKIQVNSTLNDSIAPTGYVNVTNTPFTIGSVVDDYDSTGLPEPSSFMNGSIKSAFAMRGLLTPSELTTLYNNTEATIDPPGANPGTMQNGAAFVSSVPTVLSSYVKSVDYDGGDDLTALTSGVSLNSGSSLSLWFNADAFGGMIIGHSASSNAYVRVFNSTTIRYQTNQTGTYADFTVPTMSTGTWYNLIVTRTSGNVTHVYLNGTESSTGGVTHTDPTTIDQIARYWDGTNVGLNWDGKVSDVRFYSSVLSGADISNIQSNSSTTAVPFMWYKLNEGTGTTNIDYGTAATPHPLEYAEIPDDFKYSNRVVSYWDLSENSGTRYDARLLNTHNNDTAAVTNLWTDLNRYNQHIYGSNVGGGALYLGSTTHATTKGKIYLDSLSVFDSQNRRFGIGLTDPDFDFVIKNPSGSAVKMALRSSGDINTTVIETDGSANTNITGYGSVNITSNNSNAISLVPATGVSIAYNARAAGHLLDILENRTGLTDTTNAVEISMSGSEYNTTTRPIIATAIRAVADGTRTSGSNALTNIAIHGIATGGQNNYAGLFEGKIAVTTHAIASNSDSALVWDRSTNEYKVGKINGGGITSINSQTGSSQTISAGPGLAVSSSSDVHTISFNNTLDYQVSDANNTGTSATDLYSKTVAANQFTLNGQSIHFEAAGVNNDATATVNLEVLFAGTSIAGTGAVTISGTGVWSIQGTIIRATSTTARVYTVVTIDNCTQKVFSTTANLTSLDWTATNILKLRATAGGGGGGSNDITAQMWKVVFQP